MKGPRTNQFVAPTSFMTSISRRREKIESRIVFAIRMIEATREHQARDQEDELDDPGDLQHLLGLLLGVVDLVDPCGRRLEAAGDRVQVLGPLGVTSKAGGSGFEARFSVSSGNCLRIRASASSGET